MKGLLLGCVLLGFLRGSLLLRGSLFLRYLGLRSSLFLRRSRFLLRLRRRGLDSLALGGGL